MNELPRSRRKRKILRLKIEAPAPDETPRTELPTRFLKREDAVFMVWALGGDMPKRVYRPDEIATAYAHAEQLTRDTGLPFHVLRSWRGFEPLQ